MRNAIIGGSRAKRGVLKHDGLRGRRVWRAAQCAVEPLERRVMLSAFLHQGLADPATEGWQVAGGQASGATAGPVSDAAGDSWRVREPAGTLGASLVYQQTPTSTQVREGIDFGWLLSTRIRVPVPGQAAGATSSFYGDGNRRWQMQFGSNAAGDPVVTLPAPAGQAPFSYTLQGAGQTYNTYELVYTPRTQGAELLVNGQAISPYSAPQALGPLVQWGDQASPSGGVGDFNFVEFTPFTIAWTGNANDNNWNNPANWSANRVPGPNDSVLIDVPSQPGVPTPTIQIPFNPNGSQPVNNLFCADNLQINGGTLSVAAPSEVDGTFTLSSGALGGAGNFTITGNLVWSGGEMNGSGKTLLPSGSSGTLLGNLNLAREFDNGGTLQFPQGNLGADPATGNFLFDNLASGQLTLSDTMSQVQSIGSSEVPSPFINSGNLISSAHLTSFAGPVTSTGSITVNNTGTLLVNGASTIGGTVTLALGARFFPGSGTLFTGTTFQGNFAFSNASYTVQQGASLGPGSSISLNSVSLDFVGDQTLGGQGIISLADPSNIIAVMPSPNGGPATLTINGGVTIEGEGQITGGTGTAVINDGILIGLRQALVVSVPSFTNAGTVQSQSPGAVSFTGGVFTNTSGTADITGNLNTDSLTINGGSFLYDGLADGSVRQLNLAAPGALGGAGNLSVAATINWGDRTSIGGTGKLTLLQGVNGGLSGNLTLDRELDNAGTLNLANVQLGGNGGILNNLSGGQLILSGQNTIGGAAAPDVFTNAGTLTSLGSTIVNGPFTNTGTVNVNGGDLVLSGPNTIGGTVSLVPGAQFLPASGTLYTGTTFQGAFTFSNDSFNVQQGFTLGNASSVSLNLTKLNFIGDQTLGGQGTLSLGDSSSIIAVLPPATGGSATLTLSGGITIQGQGQITGNLGTSVLNDGILIALLKPLVVSVPSFTNDGTIRGRNGGAVSFTGGVFINNGGSADISGNLSADALTINGGSFSYNGLADGSVKTLTLARTGILGGAGNLIVATTINWGDATTINGTGKLTLAQGSIGTITGNLTLDRELDNGGTLNLSAVQLNGGTHGTLNNLPSGQINLSGQNTIGGAAAPDTLINAGTLTQGQGSTTVNGPFTNTGTLTLNGGTLTLSGPNTIGGTVTLATGAQFLPATGTLFTGPILQGSFAFSNDTFNVQQGVTLKPGSSVALNLTKLNFIGDQTLGGSGKLSLGDSSSIIAVVPPGTGGPATLTVNAGITIQGEGQITGGTGTSVINDGILIGLRQALVVSVPSFTNAGTVQGQSPGSVSFTGGVFVNTGGTADIAGNLTANALTINGGRFLYDGLADGSVTVLTLAGNGALGGVGNVSVAGTINWGDGTSIGGSGKLALAAGGTGTLLGNLSLSREFDNGGSINSTGFTLHGDGGLINNLGGALFNGTGDHTFGAAAGDIAFVNQGTFTRSGPGTTTFNGPFTTTGTVNLNGGTLILNGANTIGGTVAVAQGAQFQASNGTTLQRVTLQGNFGFNNATLDVRQGVTLNAGSAITLNLTKLNFIGDQTLGGSGTVTLADSSSVIALTPPATGGSATLTLGAGVTISGQGTISGGTTSALVNNGTLSGQGRFDVAVPNVISAGTIAILSGTLQLDGNATIDGGVSINNGASLVLGAGNIVSGPQVLFATGSSLSGGGTVQFQGNSTSQIFGSFSVGATILQDSAAVAFLNAGSSGTLTVNGGTLTIGGAVTTTTAGIVAAVTLPDTLDVITQTIISGGTVLVLPGWTMEADGSGLVFVGPGNVMLSNSDATPGTLLLGGDLTYNASALASVGVSGSGAHSGLLDLGGASRNFLVNNSSPQGLSVSAALGDGSVDKSGAGTLTLSGGGTFSGGTTIVDGIVQIHNASALGSGGITFAGGTLALGPGAVPANPLTVAAAISMNLDVGSNAAQLDIPALGAALNLSGSAGGSLTVNNSVTLQHDVDINAAVSVTVNGAISGGFGIFKTGAGTLTLGGASANTFTGTTEVDGGTLVLGKASGVAIPGALVVNAPGAVRLAAAGQLGSASAVTLDSTIAAVTFDLGGFATTTGPLTVMGGNSASLGTAPATLTTSGLSISAGKLDLGKSKLLVGYGVGPDPAATIRTYIAGSSLITSAAGLVLGDADSADGVVSGLAAHTVFVRPTVVGDTNLDGQVNFADLVALAAHYGTSSGGTWDHGDFNRDGKINFADLVALAANYGHAAPASNVLQVTAALGRARPRPIRSYVGGRGSTRAVRPM